MATTHLSRATSSPRAERLGAPGPSPHVRSTETPDGLVLMDVRTGKYYAMNATAEALWRAVERGEPLEGAANDVAVRTRADAERVTADFRHLLADLERHGLVERVAAGPPGARSAAAAAPAAEALASAAGPMATTPERAASPLPRRWPSVLLALLGLAVAEVVLLFGFPVFHRMVRRLPRGASRPPSPGELEWAVTVVETAARAHFRRAWCLQRSCALLWVLRSRHLAADLVIGVRRLPFAAHAWVEAQGRVVGDDPRLCGRYQVIERC